MKATIEQIEYLIVEMKKAKVEHPKAVIYYDWENSEIRITYPIPRDLLVFKTNDTFEDENPLTTKREKGK